MNNPIVVPMSVSEPESIPMTVSDGETLNFDMRGLFLQGGGGAVTGVKGNAEQDFRTGDVNLSPADLGVDLASLATKAELPRKTSDLTNDSNFVSDANYVHTDTNFTAADAQKLSGLQNLQIQVDDVWQNVDALSQYTAKAVPLRHISEMIQAIFRRAGNMSYIESGGISYNVVQTWFTAAMLEYDSTSGARGLYIGSYGFYPNLTAPTFSSTSNVSPTVTIKYPTWMARCNSSYFATARAPEVDQHETTLKRKLEVYRVERSIICNALYDNFTDVYNNPL